MGKATLDWKGPKLPEYSKPKRHAKVAKQAKQAKQTKQLSEIFNQYQNVGRGGQLRPEGFLEISRVFGPEASIDMNRLVCQHQQNVASAYMRQIRREKDRRQDSHFRRLNDIPLKIRRMDVGPEYVDAYSNFKSRLPKLGYTDNLKNKGPPSPTLPNMASPYVSHNSLAPHTNFLFKMNPTGKEPTALAHTATTGSHHAGKRVEDDLPFPLSPRKLRFGYKQATELPAIKKRLSVAESAEIRGSIDITPRCPSNSPRSSAAFWSFTVPRELNQGTTEGRGRHTASIPRGKDALAAISSVQKHNRPKPMSSTIPPLPPISAKA